MTVPAEITVTPEDATFPGPFEGPEKLLEVWFAPSFDLLPEPSTPLKKRVPTHELDKLDLSSTNGESGDGAATGGIGSSVKRKGLRIVPRAVWEEMLDIVKCKVLSVVEGDELDAYLLSESSLFVAPHVLILKTCGTTLNLLGLHRIIEIAREYCGFTNIWRCFYSRKSFFFPERQSGPHKDWRDEVTFLDSVFCSAGSAYTVGPMNRDHWLLYLTSPDTLPLLPSDSSLSNSSFRLSLPCPGRPPPTYQDQTLEILMTHLSPSARAPFFHAEATSSGSSLTGHELGLGISTRLGIDKLFPAYETTLDSYGFDPCGYSANAVIGSGMPEASSVPGKPGGGYFTIHVTPEEGWSYASFECNVPLPMASSSSTPSITPSSSNDSVSRPHLTQLIRNVVGIFQPSRLSITLFVSTPPSSSSSSSSSSGTDQGPTSTSETEARAWQAFSMDLLGEGYTRKDRIGYEFDGYDLVFACFEKRGWVEEKVQ
ncbi:S-adenosylmethionine decarboxylase [Kockovaella imperatae]|uniref:S-adenosylmethionine decarboxylase n=1 Tax=Kockovaella imperatae TaxID=4999 RepID=A0A1Y1UIE9_9TREE|nr:S-adenosylmethionine decarboxylase [Kockovaella imperatae]ORX36875.1 S-adenosylmethionine decarboxylase [Kockovaella imperatae]